MDPLASQTLRATPPRPTPSQRHTLIRAPRPVQRTPASHAPCTRGGEVITTHAPSGRYHPRPPSPTGSSPPLTTPRHPRLEAPATSTQTRWSELECSTRDALAMPFRPKHGSAQDWRLARDKRGQTDGNMGCRLKNRNQIVHSVFTPSKRYFSNPCQFCLERKQTRNGSMTHSLNSHSMILNIMNSST